MLPVPVPLSPSPVVPRSLSPIAGLIFTTEIEPLTVTVHLNQPLPMLVSVASTFVPDVAPIDPLPLRSKKTFVGPVKSLTKFTLPAFK